MYKEAAKGTHTYTKRGRDTQRGRESEREKQRQRRREIQREKIISADRLLANSTTGTANKAKFDIARKKANASHTM